MELKNLMKKKKTIIIRVCLFCCLLASANNIIFAKEPNCDSYRRGVRLFESWQYNDALDCFIEADKENPRNGFIYYYVGNIMYFANDYQKSFDYTQQSLEYFKDEDSIGKANALLHLAFLAQYSFLHQIDGLSEDDAPSYFNTAVEVSSSYAKAYKERGIYYDIYKKDYTRSDADYKKAIELEPSEVEPYTRIIESYIERGLNDNAITYCRKCISNVTEYPHHYNTLAKLLLGQGNIEEARELIWKAFLKCDDYYYQGVNAVKIFPDEDQSWFLNKIRLQKTKYPSQKQWGKYLEEYYNS